MIITHKVNLDLLRPSWIAPIDAVQDDQYSRNLELTLTSGGEAWPIPGGTTALIHFSKADGTGGSYDTMPDGSAAWSIQDNLLTICLAPQVLTAPGMASLTVTLLRGQQQLSTFQLLLNIHPVVGKNLAPSGSYFHVYGCLPAPAACAVGQFFRAKTVDARGHVTAVEAVDPISGSFPASYSEVSGAGKQQNPANPSHEIWNQWNRRLAFGMDTENAPVPFLVGGQLLADGTIIAHNTGSQQKNRWNYHVFEAYGVNNYARLTMLLDKHKQEASGKPSSEIYYYTGADHTAASYGNTKIGSDVAFHSFCFDRDKLTAYGEIDHKMPLTLARISLETDLNTSCATVAEADAAYEPENQSAENARCLKYLALKNAENGAMFYDTDRNCPVCKINGKWCQLPFTEIQDAAYDIFSDTPDSGHTQIPWEQGVIGAYGDEVDNSGRIRTVGYLPAGVTSVVANNAHDVCAVFLDNSGVSQGSAYYNPGTGSLSGNVAWTTSIDLKNVSFPGFPNIRLIAKRQDYADLTPADGSNIDILFAQSEDSGNAMALAWESGVIGGYGDLVANGNRIRTTDYLPASASSVTAADGYEVCLVVLTEDGTASNNCYYNPHTNTQSSSPTWTASISLSDVAFEGYPNRKLIARRTDQGAITAQEGTYITVT